MKITVCFFVVFIITLFANGLSFQRPFPDHHRQRFERRFDIGDFGGGRITLGLPPDADFDDDDSDEEVESDVTQSLLHLSRRMSIQCLSKIQRIKHSQCKRENVAKITALDLHDKVRKQVSGVKQMTEIDKDRLCCMNEREFKCSEIVTGKSCKREMPLFRQIGNMMLKQSIDVDCRTREVDCVAALDVETSIKGASPRETEEDQFSEHLSTTKPEEDQLGEESSPRKSEVPSLEREIETFNKEASMLDVIKGLDRKTQTGLSVVNSQLSAIKKHLDEKDDLLNRKLDKILQQLQSNYAMIDK